MAVTRFSYSLPVLPVFLLLVACGGGSSSAPAATSAPDNSTPSANINVPYTGQVLLGPIVGANVFVYPVEGLESAAPICNVTTTGLDDETGPGVADLSACELEDTEIYLLVVRDGEDIDVDDDGVLDATPTAKEGSIRSLMTGAQIASGNWRINLATEIGVNGITNLLLQGETSTVLLERLDRIAQQIFDTDINGDDVINRFDLASFVPADHIDALRGLDPVTLATLLDSILAGDSQGLTRLAREILLSQLGTIEFSTIGEEFEYTTGLFDQGLWYSVGRLPEAPGISGDFSLRIFDVSDLDQTELIGQLDLSDVISEFFPSSQMEKSGDTLFVAGAGNGLIILDVTDPTQPAVLSQTQFGLLAVSAVAIDGNTAFLGNREITGSGTRTEIQALDISNLSAPVRLGTLSDVAATALSVSGGTLYAWSGGSLSTVDIDTPANMALLDSQGFGTGDLSLFSRRFALDEGFVYIATTNADLDPTIAVFDVRDPQNIILESSDRRVRPAPGLSDLVVDSGYLYGKSGVGGLVIYDIVGPGELRLVDSKPANGYRLNFLSVLRGQLPQVDIDNERIYVVGLGLFSVFDQNALRDSPINVTSLNIGNSTNSAMEVSNVKGSGDVVFLVDSFSPDVSAVGIADTNSGLTLTELDVYETSLPGLNGSRASIVVRGSYLYFASGAVLRVLEIPQDGIDGNSPGGNTLKGSDTPSRFDIIGDGRGLDSLESLGVLVVAGGVVAGVNHVYMSVLAPVDEGEGAGVIGDVVGIFDVNTNPARPTLSSTIELSAGVSAMGWQDNFLYLVVAGDLEVYNVSDPTDPSEVVTEVEGTFFGMHIDGNYLYTTSPTAGLFIFDISSPASTAQVGTAPGIGVGSDVYATGDAAYVANTFGSIDVYDTSDKTAPEFVAQIPILGSANGVVVHEDYVITSNGFGLVVNRTLSATDNLF